MVTWRKWVAWAGKAGSRAALYAVAAALLGVLASTHIYPLTILGSVVVAAGAVYVHRKLQARPDDIAPLGFRVALFVLVLEAGAAVLAVSHFQIFTAGGFAGVSMVSFGLGQLVAEMREANSLNRTIAAFSAANAVGLSIVFAVSGAGGFPMLILAAVFAYPAISFGAQVAVDWTTCTQEPDETKTSATKWFDKHWREICAVLAVVAAIALLSLYSIGGLLFIIVLAAVVFALVGAISSNTDADWLFALIAIAIVVSQVPVSDPPLKFTDGPERHEIVVFGDSYISGEGADSYLAGTNTTKPEIFNKCRRARTAWAPRVAKQQRLQLDFLACSGAKAHNIVEHGQYVGENPEELRDTIGGKPPHFLSQIELYDHQQRQATVDWAFVSIGGNNGGFGDLVAACIAPGDCTELGEQFLKRLDTLPTVLDNVYDELTDRFPGRVVVVPYPVPLREDDCGIFQSTFTRQEQRFLHRFTIELNATIERQAAASEVLFVKEMPNALVADRLRICDASAGSVGVNVFALNPVEGPIDPREWTHNSMHPKDTGHEAMAKVINDWIDDNVKAPEDPSALPAPKRDMQSLMGASVYQADASETPDSWIVAEAHRAFAHRLPGLAALFISMWGLWVMILRALRLRTARPRLSEYFNASDVRRRAAALGVLLVVAAIALTLFARLSAFPSGFNDAQSAAACSLPQDVDVLRDLRDGTTRDLLIYIPLYAALAFGAIGVTSRPAAGGFVKRRSRGGFFSDLVAGLAVLALASVDVIETLRFRHTLSRLAANVSCSSLDSYTDLTGKLTGLKWTLFGVVVMLVVARVLQRRTPDPQSDSA